MERSYSPVGTALMPSRQRHRLLGDAMQQSADGVERSLIVDHLRHGGYSDFEAHESLDTIERQLAPKRNDFNGARFRALLIASVQLLAAVVMALTGIYTDKMPTLLLGAGLAVIGYRRLRSLLSQVFGDVVLTNRPSATVREDTPGAF